MGESPLTKAIKIAKNRNYYFQIDLSPIEDVEPGDQIVRIKMFTAEGRREICEIACKLDYDDQRFAVVSGANCHKQYQGKGLGKLIYLVLLDVLANYYNLWFVSDRETVMPTALRIYKYWLSDAEIEKIQLDINLKTHQLGDDENFYEWEEIYEDPNNYLFYGKKPMLGNLSFYKSMSPKGSSIIRTISDQFIQDFWRTPNGEQAFLASPLTKGYKLGETGYKKELSQLRPMYRPTFV